MALLYINWSGTGTGISRKKLSDLLKINLMPMCCVLRIGPEAKTQYGGQRNGRDQVSTNCL